MTGSEYSKLFFEERMSYIGHLPSPAAAPEEVWRRVYVEHRLYANPETRTLQVSNRGRTRSVDSKALIYGGDLKASVHSRTYATEEARDSLMRTTFPLEMEDLCLGQL